MPPSLRSASGHRRTRCCCSSHCRSSGSCSSCWPMQSRTVRSPAISARDPERTTDDRGLRRGADRTPDRPVHRLHRHHDRTRESSGHEHDRVGDQQPDARQVLRGRASPAVVPRRRGPRAELSVLPLLARLFGLPQAVAGGGRAAGHAGRDARCLGCGPARPRRGRSHVGTAVRYHWSARAVRSDHRLHRVAGQPAARNGHVRDPRDELVRSRRGRSVVDVADASPRRRSSRGRPSSTSTS